MRIDKFAGLNNVLLPEKTPEEFLKKADNVNIDNLGGITKRQGYSKIMSGVFHSLWSDKKRCFFVKDNELKELSVDLTDKYLQHYQWVASTESILDLTGDPLLDLAGNPIFPENPQLVDYTAQFQGEVKFEELDGKYYFISEHENGVIDGRLIRPFGVPQVVNLPGLSAGIGSLTAGTYLVCYTYVDSNGLEGGTIAAASITVLDGSSINISNIIIPAQYKARIYVSNGGSQMYKLGDTESSVYIFNDAKDLTTPLRTFNISDAPNGRHIRYFKGRMFIAQDNALFYSEPQRVDKFNLADNFLLFGGNITALMPVEDGIWVGADKLYFLAGTNPKEFTKVLKEDVNCVEGSDTRVQGAYTGAISYHWMVTTTNGVYTLHNSGEMKNVTAKNVDVGYSDGAASEFVQKEGMNQYVALMKNNRPNNLRVSESVTVTHIRNGIVIS